MRIKLLFIFLLLIISVGCATAAEQPLLKDEPDQINYSLGYDLGQQAQARGLAFEPDLLWQALHDGQTGAEAQSTAPESYMLGYALGEEIEQAQLEFRGEALWQGLYDSIDHAPLLVSEQEIVQLLTGIRGVGKTARSSEPVAQAAPVKVSPPPKHYRLPGQKYMAENLSGKDVISLSSGLQYRILASGKGKKPKESDFVLVNYLGKSIEGRVFSSTARQGIAKPQEVQVSKFIPGVTQALKMMREGDRWELVIPTRLAFKDSGPMAGQTVIYDLELVEVLPEFR